MKASRLNGRYMNEIKWMFIALAAIGSFGMVALSVQEWQKGETERAKIQLEIVKLQTAGNTGK